MSKKKMHPAWWLVIGICFLVIPGTVYLFFLVPQLKEEYLILMSSGGVVGGAGMFGTAMIPERIKFGALFRTASKSFTLLVVVTLVREFISQIIGFAAVVMVSSILFLIFKELWKSGRRAKENVQLAEEIARSTAKDSQ